MVSTSKVISDSIALSYLHGCSWDRKKLEQTIYRYIRLYMKKNNPDRDFFMQQLESLAEENNFVLPCRERMDTIGTSEEAHKLAVETVELTVENRRGMYRYYLENGQVVAYPIDESPRRSERVYYAKTQWDTLFDELYPVLLKKYKDMAVTADDRKNASFRAECELTRQFYEYYDYDDNKEQQTCPAFVARKIYNLSAAFAERRKRFYRKSHQIRWTAWWTITYDDEKFPNPETFKCVLLNRFRNLSDKKGWRIMGVFENGEQNGRLHFHGFFYIPEGQNVGELVWVSRWSEKLHKRVEYWENTDFREKYGINEYDDLRNSTEGEMKARANYTQKMEGYMQKGGTVYYSRHIPTDFVGEFFTHDMILFYNINFKRKIARYVVNPHIFKRSDLLIERNISCDMQLAVDCGLLDVPV